MLAANSHALGESPYSDAICTDPHKLGMVLLSTSVDGTQNCCIMLRDGTMNAPRKSKVVASKRV